MGRLLAREIATPLTSALNNLGAARRLLLRHPPQLEEIAAAVGEAQSAGQSVADVLHRLHSLSPAAIGADDLVDLSEVVREGVRLVAGVRIVAVAADLSPLPPIRGDRVELLQVVLELLLNALEEASAPGRARDPDPVGQETRSSYRSNARGPASSGRTARACSHHPSRPSPRGSGRALPSPDPSWSRTGAGSRRSSHPTGRASFPNRATVRVRFECAPAVV